MIRISICTVCKGQLHHLRETLPRNLEDNRHYPNLEFVLLDDHLEDGVKSWVEHELRDHVESGRLSHFRLVTQGPFQAAHARNVSIRLASGDVVCVVDADQYTGRGFAQYVANTLEPDKVLVGGDVGFAIHKNAYLDVGGMDEEADIDSGNDDANLYARLGARGYEILPIPHHYLQGIRRKPAGGGSSPVRNRRPNMTALREGRIVVNDGRIGCGGVFKTVAERGLVVHERRNPRISICLACDRNLAALRETLPRNLDSVSTYPEVEFVLHESAEEDTELGGWLESKFARELSSGRIVHGQMARPDLDGEANGKGNPVHQQNQAMRMARGDILISCPPGWSLPDDLTSRLLVAYHGGGWIHEMVSEDPAVALLSRHLFYMAEGLDQDLPAESAHADLVARIDAQLSGKTPPRWTAADGLETRDFGGGTVWRAGALEVISPHRFPRVSLTFSCMGRLQHLSTTLPKNLADNIDYPNLEFVLVNYGDRTGLDEWVRGEMREHVESGRLVYHHSPDQPVWRFGHAKNIALRLATGDLLCNLDADNFAGHHFAFHLAERLREHDFLVGSRFHQGKFETTFDPGTAGRVALPRWAYYQVGGYDESLHGWGHDDIDLCERLLAQGLRPVSIDSRFLTCIEHGDEFRVANQDIPDNSGQETFDRGTAQRNKQKSERNIANGKLVANAGNFGCGTVNRGLGTDRVEVRPVESRRISVCVTCMGRRHHLVETLPKNLADNARYPNLEFVILDYNSNDGLEEWVKKHLGDEIGSGRVTYYRTTEPSFFDRSHARNVAFRLAGGEIVCNVDADNFTGLGFASYVNERFGAHDNIYLQPDLVGAHRRLRGAFGRLCVRKRDFLNIEGYDEGLDDEGWEDLDVCLRLQKSGLRPLFYEGEHFLRFIHHDSINRNDERHGKDEPVANVRVNGGNFGRAVLSKNFSPERLPVEALRVGATCGEDI